MRNQILLLEVKKNKNKNSYIYMQIKISSSIKYRSSAMCIGVIICISSLLLCLYWDKEQEARDIKLGLEMEG